MTNTVAIPQVDRQVEQRRGSGGRPSALRILADVPESQRAAWRRRLRDSGKRAVDLVLGTVATVVALPLLALLALLVLVMDGRPVFFVQTRIGRGNRPFRMFKLRSMVRDAEARLGDLVAENERKGPLFKLAEDPRVTRLGHFLRDSSLDELPQLLNVLRGDMSLVGPRPALPHEVDDFDDDLRRRHQVRPGITGLWQLRSRDQASFESYQRLDLLYVDNWSLRMDLAILVRTAPAVVMRAAGRFGRTAAARTSDGHLVADSPNPAVPQLESA